MTVKSKHYRMCYGDRGMQVTQMKLLKNTADLLRFECVTVVQEGQLQQCFSKIKDLRNAVAVQRRK